MEPDVETYPMPSFPTLVVSDIGRSSEWYRALGFVSVFTMPGPNGLPSLVHLRWAKYADLLLFPDRDGSMAGLPRGRGVGLNYLTDDLDAVSRRARELAAQVVEGPVQRPWNVREMVVLDPDGYRLVFNEPQQSGARAFDDIVADGAKGFKR